MSQMSTTQRFPRSSEPSVSSGAQPVVRSRSKAKLQPNGLHTARKSQRKWFTGLDQMIDLPRPTGRWTIRRKAVVVAAVRTGMITLEKACERYELSVEEFLTWWSRAETAWRLPV
jgi:Protein of unknown function (DUF1153)